MKLKYFVLSLILLFIPNFVSAKYEVTNPLCTDNEKIKLREEALKINYVLEKYIDKNVIYYKVTVVNVSTNISIDYLNKTYKNTNGEIIILGVDPGTTMSLNLFTNTSHVCSGYKIYTKNILVPYYNKFKDNELCIGNEEYFLCKENTSTKVTEEEFTRLINEYIKNKGKNNNETPNEEEPPVDNETAITDVIIDFLLNYYLYILIGIIVLGTTGIVVILVRKRRSIL